MALTQCSEAATRRATRANDTPAAPAGVPSGANMTAEDEKTLIEAAQAMKRSGLVQFNFKDMDLVRFVRFMSEILDENIIVPPNVNAKITIISPHPVTLRESREVGVACRREGVPLRHEEAPGDEPRGTGGAVGEGQEVPRQGRGMTSPVVAIQRCLGISGTYTVDDMVEGRGAAYRALHIQGEVAVEPAALDKVGAAIAPVEGHVVADA